MCACMCVCVAAADVGHYPFLSPQGAMRQQGRGGGVGDGKMEGGVEVVRALNEEEVGGALKEQRPINHGAVSALTPSLSEGGQGRGPGGGGGWGEGTAMTTLWPCLPVDQAHAGQEPFSISKAPEEELGRKQRRHKTQILIL